MNKKNYKKRKKRLMLRQPVRQLMGAFLFVVEFLLFYDVWTRYYNAMVRWPFFYYGNIFISAMYLIIIMMVSKVYAGTKIGYYRVSDILMSQVIVVFLSNIVAYFILVTPLAYGWISAWPLIWLTVVDIGVIVIWALLSHRIFLHIFPPQQLVIVSEKQLDTLLDKFSRRPDQYIVRERICLELTDDLAENERIARKVVAHCEGYDGVIIGDIRAIIRNDIMKMCFAKGLRTYTMPKISDIILRYSENLHIFDSPVLLNRNFGLTTGQAFFKRLIDLLCSGIGLVVLSPVMLITALAIKREDGGPVFYKQVRCTIRNREFEIIKFRSMVVNAEKDGVARLAQEGDSRITKVGAFIRKVRIDEIPQLINIFKGDMSLVGPRPERPEIMAAYCQKMPEFAFRTKVKAGLTGFAQIYGKYNTTPFDKLKLDLMYIMNYSIIQDGLLILKTIKTVFTKEATEGVAVGQTTASDMDHENR